MLVRRNVPPKGHLSRLLFSFHVDWEQKVLFLWLASEHIFLKKYNVQKLREWALVNCPIAIWALLPPLPQWSRSGSGGRSLACLHGPCGRPALESWETRNIWGWGVGGPWFLRVLRSGSNRALSFSGQDHQKVWLPLENPCPGEAQAPCKPEARPVITAPQGSWKGKSRPRHPMLQPEALFAFYFILCIFLGGGIFVRLFGHFFRLSSFVVLPICFRQKCLATNSWTHCPKGPLPSKEQGCTSGVQKKGLGTSSKGAKKPSNSKKKKQGLVPFELGPLPFRRTKAQLR